MQSVFRFGLSSWVCSHGCTCRSRGGGPRPPLLFPRAFILHLAVYGYTTRVSMNYAVKKKPICAGMVEGLLLQSLRDSIMSSFCPKKSRSPSPQVSHTLCGTRTAPTKTPKSMLWSGSIAPKEKAIAKSTI